MSNSTKQRYRTRRHASTQKKNRRVPSLRFHKASGQLYVVLSGRAIYCGKPDDPTGAASVNRLPWIGSTQVHVQLNFQAEAFRQLKADNDALQPTAC